MKKALLVLYAIFFVVILNSCEESTKTTEGPAVLNKEEAANAAAYLNLFRADPANSTGKTPIDRRSADNYGNFQSRPCQLLYTVFHLP